MCAVLKCTSCDVNYGCTRCEVYYVCAVLQCTSCDVNYGCTRGEVTVISALEVIWLWVY